MDPILTQNHAPSLFLYLYVRPYQRVGIIIYNLQFDSKFYESVEVGYANLINISGVVILVFLSIYFIFIVTMLSVIGILNFTSKLPFNTTYV